VSPGAGHSRSAVARNWTYGKIAGFKKYFSVAAAKTATDALRT
jgi:hypothetical protein